MVFEENINLYQGMKPEPLTEINRFKCSTRTEINYFSRTKNRNVRTGMVSVHFKMFFFFFLRT